MATYVIKKDGAEFKATQVRAQQSGGGHRAAPKRRGGWRRCRLAACRCQLAARWHDHDLSLGRGSGGNAGERWRREGLAAPRSHSRKNSLSFSQVDEGADATASAATLAELVAELTAGNKGHSLSEVVPGKSAVLTVA